MSLLDASCRMAFAALSHDLGKFAQRADFAVSAESKKIHEQLYCPRNEYGYPTHIHAAYTAMAFSELESWTPDLVHGDTAPFHAGGTDQTDSIVNAAGRHHRPESFLQWIVKTADCAASGFEREDALPEEIVSDGVRHDYITTRQWSLFEEIRLDRKDTASPIRFRKPLRPLSVEALFPKTDIEPAQRAEGRKEYASLWRDFVAAGRDIPSSLRTSWPLWLDAFESLWLTFTHAIPSATAFGAKPDVSLFDHSKCTAALATALWRWYHDQAAEKGVPLDEAAALESMQNRSVRQEETLLLIQGDFFGIQNFIFSGHEKTNGKMAKILRGRSFYVSLLTEACALRILEALDLPSTAQITNAAGKFLIVAPNTPRTVERLQTLRREIDDWFVQHTCAEAGIGLVWQPARLLDLSQGNFPALMRRMTQTLERAKRQRLRLCDDPHAPEVLPVSYPLGVCAWQGRWPADRQEGDLASCALSRDQIAIGRALTRSDLLLLVKDGDASLSTHRDDTTLEVPVFGYRVVFTDAGRFDSLVQKVGAHAVRRAWDLSMPKERDEILWKGFGRRSISSYIPRFAPGEENANPVYDEGLDRADIGPDRIKPFSWLSREDLFVEADESVRGVDAIAHLKGDVDQLGRIFQEGLADPDDSSIPPERRRTMTFAKMAGLSREMNAFFSVCVPYLCRTEHPSIYTVFAGGDDFSFIGPRAKTQQFATDLHKAFMKFVTGNPEVHFSAGFAVTKPGIPVRALSDAAEAALEAAKGSGRNAVTIYGLTFPWAKWYDLQAWEISLERLRQEYDLSTSYLYSLFELMALAEQKNDPRAAIWRSRLHYRTVRFAGEKARTKEDVRPMTDDLLKVIGAGIETEGERFRVPLTNLFYRIRTYRR